LIEKKILKNGTSVLNVTKIILDTLRFYTTVIAARRFLKK